jgi:tRNA threonylcarbamoyladenosine biosynthesis protein TsaB
MFLLALDTTAGCCSVALLRDGVLSACSADAGQGTSVSPGPAVPSHSQLLLPMIDALLAREGTPLSALDAIAFGAGPGSFTGLRIACGVAQGLGLAIDRPLVAVDSLSSMAWASGRDEAIACLDARMGEVYCAAYRILRSAGGPDGPDVPAASIEVVFEPRACAPHAVPVPVGPGWTGCGNGFSAYATALQERLPALASVDAEVMPDARAVAALGAIAYRAGRAVDAALAAPRYVRDKVALDSGEQAALRAGAAVRVAAGVTAGMTAGGAR